MAGYGANPMQTRQGAEAGLIWQAVDDPAVRARAIAVGADEVIGPWMEPCEALARALRFASRDAGAVAARIEIGELAIDLIEREAIRRGKALGLLKREMELLLAFAHRPGAVLSRAQLLRLVWRLSFDPGTNVVQVHVSRLRSKLDCGFEWPMLRTVRGMGYRLIAEPCGANG